MPDEDARRIADELADAREIVRVGGDVDSIGIDRRRAPPVATVMPMRERDRRCEVVPQIFPNEAVADDPVAQDRPDAFGRVTADT
jgi:hypothetical protein